MNEIYILRGLPGSGKSWLAEHIKNVICHGNGYIYAEDDWFTDGNLRTIHEIESAREFNINRTLFALKDRKSPIIVNGIHSKCWHAQLIVQFALLLEYKVVFMEPITPWWKSKNITKMASMNKDGYSFAYIQRLWNDWDKEFNLLTIMNARIPAAIKQRDKPKKLFIVRGAPGSGKYTLADTINDSCFQGRGFVLDAKDYFTVSNAGAEKHILMTEARIWNQKRAELCFDHGLSPLFLVDVFSQRTDIKPFLIYATFHKYDILVLEPQTDWWINRDLITLAERSGHTYDDIENILQRWEYNFELKDILL